MHGKDGYLTLPNIPCIVETNEKTGQFLGPLLNKYNKSINVALKFKIKEY